MKKILVIILLVAGIAGGGAAGLFLKPAEKPDKDGEKSADAGHAGAGDAEHGAAASEHASDAHGADGDGHGAGVPGERDYVNIGRQIIVPVVDGGETRALMMFQLAIDVPLGRSDAVFSMEPRLRDAFLRELMEMSYTGAFMSNFTDDRIIEELRQNLVAAARKFLGNDVKDVLILDILRQEL